MRFILAIFAFALNVIFFNACATKEPPPPTPQPLTIKEDELKLVLIKSLNIRFYDFGTLSVNESDSNNPTIELKVLKLGKLLGSFVINKKEICYIDLANRNDCAPKWPAARSFFGNVSYGELFDDILQKKDIFDGIGKRLEANGTVIQQFSYGGEKIYYERSEKRIYFKNFTNGVIVSIENYIDTQK